MQQGSADQSEIVALLGRPQTHGGQGPVERVDTHISHLFLAGDRAYKLKRAVRFPDLDFSTAALRWTGSSSCGASIRTRCSMPWRSEAGWIRRRSPNLPT